MAVYVNNITINIGEDFSKDFYLDQPNGTPLNLVGYAGSSHIRKHPESITKTAEFNVSFVNNASGKIRLSLGSTITSSIKPGRYVYDVLLTDASSKKSIVIEGNILAREDATYIYSTVKTSYTYSQVGVIIETYAGSGPSDPTPSPVITVDNISDYGVVHMGVNFNQCSGFVSGSSSTKDLLDNSSTRQQIINYIQLGGVLWFNGEWWNNNGSGEGCSSKTNINAILTLLGTEIRAENDVAFIGNAIRSNQSSVVNSGFPATQPNNASVIFSGGTPVYLTSDSSYVIATYEKIGQGILYVTGDSNTFAGPTYPSTYYDALRALVLNS